MSKGSVPFLLFALAQRGIFHNVVSLGQMDTTTLHIQVTVDKVLQNWPRAFSVFMKNKTKCPGCFMQQFCTLKDVAETYQISVEKLMEEIINVSQENL
jgi:hybrid cluster-associated redox disulfide protein